MKHEFTAIFGALGCHLKREGRSHSLWTNPQAGKVEAVPRYSEIADKLAHKICRNLSVPHSL